MGIPRSVWVYRVKPKVSADTKGNVSMFGDFNAEALVWLVDGPVHHTVPAYNDLQFLKKY